MNATDIRHIESHLKEKMQHGFVIDYVGIDYHQYHENPAAFQNVSFKIVLVPNLGKNHVKFFRQDSETIEILDR